LVLAQTHHWKAVEDCAVAKCKYQIGHAGRSGHFNTVVCRFDGWERWIW
jgi:hypothetical protein